MDTLDLIFEVMRSRGARIERLTEVYRSEPTEQYKHGVLMVDALIDGWIVAQLNYTHLECVLTPGWEQIITDDVYYGTLIKHTKNG